MVQLSDECVVKSAELVFVPRLGIMQVSCVSECRIALVYVSLVLLVAGLLSSHSRRYHLQCCYVTAEVSAASEWLMRGS